jgi:hypothetical protein
MVVILKLYSRMNLFFYVEFKINDSMSFNKIFIMLLEPKQLEEIW